MAKIKKRGQREHAPYEFKSMTHDIADFYQEHQKQFNAGLLLVAVVIVAAILFSMAKAGKEKSAGLLLETAYASYGDRGGRDQNYEKALQGFQEVVRQYGGTVNAAIAQFYAGNTLVKMGRTEDALKAYQECVQRYSGEKFVAAQAYQRMGYLHLSLGKDDDAAAAFNKAEALTGAGVATLELARLLERAGKTKEADAKYRELTERLPGTVFAQAVRAKLPPPELGSPKSAPAATGAK